MGQPERCPSGGLQQSTMHAWHMTPTQQRVRRISPRSGTLRQTGQRRFCEVQPARTSCAACRARCSPASATKGGTSSASSGAGWPVASADPKSRSTSTRWASASCSSWMTRPTRLTKLTVSGVERVGRGGGVTGTGTGPGAGPSNGSGSGDGGPGDGGLGDGGSGDGSGDGEEGGEEEDGLVGGVKRMPNTRRSATWLSARRCDVTPPLRTATCWIWAALVYSKTKRAMPDSLRISVRGRRVAGEKPSSSYPGRPGSASKLMASMCWAPEKNASTPGCISNASRIRSSAAMRSRSSCWIRAARATILRARAAAAWSRACSAAARRACSLSRCASAAPSSSSSSLLSSPPLSPLLPPPLEEPPR
mmetsp:Transcript_12333/g.39195  ORF Transcript_12333/g.39195 Transcript_12333/m.39195 type:complete len:363 (-) Transcript_12333:1761-2849(-)